MIWALGSIWKVFQLVQTVFERFGAGMVSWGGLIAPQAVIFQASDLTAQDRQSNCTGQNEQNFALCCVPVMHCCIGSVRVCFGSGGACICARGALCVVRALDW
jgi:hypothetical protein